MQIWRLLRPFHWIKNILVFLPVIFSNNLTQSTLVVKALLAVATFCGLASSAYLFNDILDVEYDRRHRVKKERPLASGAVKITTAWLLFFPMTLGALGLSWHLGREVFTLGMVYFFLNTIYSRTIKFYPPLDMIVVSIFYLLRVLFGTAAISREPTHWIILTTFFAALYLVSLKRRAEFSVAEKNGIHTRQNLGEFVPRVMHILTPTTLAATILCYALYSSTFAFPFVWSTLLVVAIGFRTVLLAERGIERFEFPERLLFEDRQTQLLALAWLCFVVFYHWK